MRVLVQRVHEASCSVQDQVLSAIQTGYLLLVGFTHSDTIEEVKKAARKIANLRIFSDAEGKMNLSIQEVDGEILSISQFTLYADPKSGNRPSFTSSMQPQDAERLYQAFNRELEKHNLIVKTGKFGEHMDIALTNNGPVTVLIEF